MQHFLFIALLASPASQPAAQAPAKAASQPTAAADDEDADTADDTNEAVDDEAAELWKLQELDAQNALIIDESDWLPVSDIDAAHQQSLRLRRTHPEEIATLLESDPAALLGRRLVLPIVDTGWPMFVEYDGKSGLFDPKSFDIPMQTHPMVEQWMAFFTGRGREYFQRWLARSTRYIPIFREILKEHNMPADTVYLSMIESGFNVRAFSHAKAAGPWQFMKGTGVRFGLKVDNWVDDRRDWIKATHAAAKYLLELHKELGHWYLAWAGYNAGGGRIRKAISRNGTREFFELIQNRGLHPETKNYVPKLIAAAIIAKSPRRFGFTDVDFLRPFEFETVLVDGGTDLRYCAQAARMELDEMLEMNPSLKFGITPPDKKWELRIPKGTKSTFLEKLAALMPKTKTQYRFHSGRRGETLTGIASMYGSTPEVIREQNRLSGDARLARGIDLIVPLVPGIKAVAPPPPPPRVASAPRAPGAPLAVSKGSYVVQPGDSLWSISQALGCTVADLKQLNGINNHRGLQAGQAIKVPQ